MFHGSKEASVSLPLSHIKVVEITQGLAAPMTAMHLADQGAEVIKIEPHDGDSSRGGSPGLQDAHPNLSLRILTYNRNKRAMVVDFTKPQGLEIIHHLVRKSDVLVINTRVGPRKRHGLTYEDLAAINPRLVYASITAYGDEGPDADLPGVDMNIQPRSGDLMARRSPGGSPPGQTSLWHFDMSTAMLALAAIMMALYEREFTGKGQRVEANLLQSAMALETLQLTRVNGQTKGYPAKSEGLPSIYLCKDGRYIYTGVGGARFEELCKILGLDALAEDPRFNSPDKRLQNERALHALMANHLSTKTAAEWDAILKRGQRPGTVLQEIADLFDDPQVLANNMIIEFEQPGVGSVKALNVPFKMSDHLHDQRVRLPVPGLGQHTQEVLQELGYSLAKIEALKKQKVVA
ncbi:MAG: CoA transferase [Dehalococcoidia bacterium]|nr:CoA transferase [Dehalococcoidia bacterium]